ncbi:MAG: hypothetical protein ACTHJJ_18965 [Intrasporangium sp.]|uniref:hypothetical protein n=1 Tax=Intrasporangium sp. TaxID=1925024 RepID=UPI003F7D9A8E
MRFSSTRRAPAALRVAVLAAALCALVTVCLGPPAPALDGPVISGSTADCVRIAADPHSVTVIGDSLTKLSIEHVRAAFQEAGRPLCYNAQSGRRSDQAVAVGKQLRETGQLGQTVVLALGTNDTVLDTSVLNAAYESLLEDTAPRTTTFAIGWRGPDPANSARVQDLMTDWDAASARVHSMRWGDVVAAHPEYLLGDRFHLTGDGQVAYAAFLLAAAERQDLTRGAAEAAVTIANLPAALARLMVPAAPNASPEIHFPHP